MAMRPLEATDTGFVATNWANSYRHRALKWSRVEPGVYEREQRKLIDRMLGAAEFSLLVNAEVPRTIYGWACATGRVLQYVYVVPELRKRGIARALCEQLEVWGERVVCSHRWTKKNPRIEWNPYAAGMVP